MGCGDFKVVIAVDSCDFLNDICLDCDILCGSPGGYADGENAVFFINSEAEKSEGVANLLIADVDAGIAIDIRPVEREGDGRIFFDIFVSQLRINNSAAVNVL